MDRLNSEDDITRERPQTVPLGPIELMTDIGPVTYLDAAMITNGPVKLPDQTQKVVIMAVMPQTPDGRLWGSISQFTPDEARTFAATLCQTADKIDGRGVKN